MTAAVQAPLPGFEDQLRHLNLNGGGYSNFHKAKHTEAEKERLVYGTSYEPSLAWWHANQAEYRRPPAGQDELPDGFPAQVVSSSLWDGKTLINEPDKWLYTFTSADLALIESAYTHFTSLKTGKNSISRSSFPVPETSELFKVLKQVTYELNHGLGFRVLRGLPVDEWEREKQIVVFAGLAEYIGGKRLKQGVQNIVHLRDITYLDEDKRPAITVKGQTSGNQVFHNDGGVGIVGLVTLGVAETGGLSQLSSVAQTYNDLTTHRRDVVRELAKDDWVTKVFPEGKPLIFAVENNQVISSYSRRPFFGFYEANPDVPPLTQEKHLTLDAIHFTAEKYSLDLDLQKGDLEFFNNLTVFHARTSSEDSATNARHLVRIWKENPEQPVPADLREAFSKLYEGEATTWPLEAWDLDSDYYNQEDRREKKGLEQ